MYEDRLEEGETAFTMPCRQVVAAIPLAAVRARPAKFDVKKTDDFAGRISFGRLYLHAA